MPVLPPPGSRPENRYYGQYAIMSRLISTLVCENMVSAYFIPAIHDTRYAMYDNPFGRTVMGFCFMTNLHENTNGFDRRSLYVFAALCGIPELCPGRFITLNDSPYQKIDLMHPWDILPYIYGPSDNVISFDFPVAPNHDCSFLPNRRYMRYKAVRQLRLIGLQEQSLRGLKEGYDHIRLWRRCAYDLNVPARTTDMFATWLMNSSEIQTHAYDNSGPLPDYRSTPIQWEHSVMEGHPLFPANRGIRTMLPLPQMTPYDFTNLLREPRVQLAAIPRNCMELNGNFEEATHVLVDKILNENGDAKETRALFRNYVLVPVHEVQVPSIEAKMPNVHVFPQQNHVVAKGLSSVRTLAVPGVVDGQTIKLSFGTELASILRPISRTSANFSYRFSTEVVPYMSYRRDLLTIQTEPASACYYGPNSETAKHLCCIVRNSEEIRTTATNDSFAVCAALVEKIQRADTNQTLVKEVWNLSTEEECTAFLDIYIRLFFTAIIPPCRDNGIAFDCHAQNMILQFDSTNGDGRGFLIREICNMQVHRETLVRTIGRRIGYLFPRGGYNCVNTLEEVYAFLYYGAIYLHLQTLIRVLGLHENGVGWNLARTHFAALVNQSHPMYEFFMGRERVPIMSFMRTSILNIHVNNAFFDDLLKPNLLFTGVPGDQRPVLSQQGSPGSHGSSSESSLSWVTASGDSVQYESRPPSSTEQAATTYTSVTSSKPFERSSTNQLEHIEEANHIEHMEEINQPTHTEEINHPEHMEETAQQEHMEETNKPEHIQEVAQQMHIEEASALPRVDQASRSQTSSEQESSAEAPFQHTSKQTKKKLSGSKGQGSSKAQKNSKQATAPQTSRKKKLNASSSRTTETAPVRRSSRLNPGIGRRITLS